MSDETNGDDGDDGRPAELGPELLGVGIFATDRGPMGNLRSAFVQMPAVLIGQSYGTLIRMARDGLRQMRDQVANLGAEALAQFDQGVAAGEDGKTAHVAYDRSYIQHVNPPEPPEAEKRRPL